MSSRSEKEGFGVLTRINLHEKFKEKLNEEIPPTVILGAQDADCRLEKILKEVTMPLNSIQQEERSSPM